MTLKSSIKPHQGGKSAATCRFCGNRLEHSFAHLGMSPFANFYVPMDRADAMEPFYPLHAYVCTQCWLVQLQVYETSQHIFSDYAYFSSYSDSCLAHAKAYAEKMIARFELNVSVQLVAALSSEGLGLAVGP